MNLQAFDFKNRWWLFLIALPIPFILFLSCFLIYAVAIERHNQFAFFSTFALFLFLSYLVTRLLAKKFRFISMGRLQLVGNELRLSEHKNSLLLEDGTHVIVRYAGDKYWKSSFRPLMWYKQLFRYDHLWYTSNLSDLYDYLEVNGQRVYVRISNESDKHAFLELAERLEKLNVRLTKKIE